MTNELPKISTEDEARLIFNAARSGLGNSSVARLDENQLPTDSALVKYEGGKFPQKYNSGVVCLPQLNAIEGQARVSADRLAIISNSSEIVLPAKKADVVETDERLRESPREAFRRLQRKAEGARTRGFIE